MKTQQIAPQKEFKSLEEFIKNSNNFYIHFIDYFWMVSECYRKRPAFIRFQEKYPDIEKDLTLKTGSAYKIKKSLGDLPWEQLFDAYKKMSPLVYLDDEYVTSHPDYIHLYLTR